MSPRHVKDRESEQLRIVRIEYCLDQRKLIPVGVLLALVALLLTSNYYTTHASGISDSGTPKMSVIRLVLTVIFTFLTIRMAGDEALVLSR